MLTENKDGLLEITTAEENEILNQELALVPPDQKADIEKVVKSADLVLIGKHRAQIAAFKKKYPKSKFVFKPGEPLNKKDYDKAMDAWRLVKSYRTKTMKGDFEALKGPLNTVLNFYNGEQKPIFADCQAIEGWIGEYIDQYEKAEETQKNKEKIELEQRTNKRLDDIVKAGMVFDGSWYAIGNPEYGVETITLGMATINAMSDTEWEPLLEKIKSAGVIIAEKDAAKAEEERLQKEKEKQELQKHKENNLRLRAKELTLQGFVKHGTTGNWEIDKYGIEVYNNQVEELDLDAWDLLMEDIGKKIADKTAYDLQQKMINERSAELVTIGLAKGLTGYVFNYNGKSVLITNELIAAAPVEDWSNIINTAKNNIATLEAEKKSDAEKADAEKRLAEERELILAPYWVFVTPAEKATLGQIGAGDFDVLLENKKEQHQKKINDDAIEENKKQQEKLEKEGDEAVFNDLVEKFKAITIPEFKTEQYKNMANTIKTFINRL